MSIPFDFFEAAIEDVEVIIEYLDQQHPGYGGLFYDQLYATIDLVCRRPEAYPITEEREDLRRIPMSKPFQSSYTLFYHFDGSTVFIVSVFHNSQDPRRWQRR